jgi:HK97 family phage major capsid protein
MQMHPGNSGALDVRGWGELFTDSDAFRNYPGAGNSQRVSVPTGLDEPTYQQRAAIGIGTYPVQPPYLWSPPTPAILSPLLQVVGKVTVNTNAVSWVQWTPNPPSAAAVVAEGALKTEATMTATAVSDTLDTYAHYKEITRQALEDIPQIRQTVENRLRQGVMVALETAITAALVAATIPAAPGATGTSLMESLRAGMATVQAAGYTPNAVALNPVDWAEIDIAIMGGTLNGASVNGSLWGMRLVAVPALAAGTAYVGDFNTGVQLFSRSTTEVFLSDSHADNFLRNILVLLAETRALATVPEPAALAECAAVP